MNRLRILSYTHTHTHTHTHTEEYHSALKTKEILSFLTIWINLEGVMLSEISQTERQILHGIIYMWNLKKGKHFEFRNRE